MGEIIRLEGKSGPKSLPETLLDGERFPILAGMAPVLLHVLNQSATLMHVSDGVEILQQGDIPQDLYFVVDGTVGIVKKSDGKRNELRHLGIGGVFGELGALRGRNRVASVYTQTLSRIIRVPADTIRKLMEIDPDFRDRINLMMNRRIIETFLACHPVFEGLPEEVLLSLVELMELRTFPKGGRVFSTGDDLDGVHLIVAGEVGVNVDLPDGGSVLLEMRRDNDVIGELPDERSGKASYSAIASSESDVLHFDHVVMRLLHNQCPEVAERLDNYIDHRARVAQVRVDLHRP